MVGVLTTIESCFQALPCRYFRCELFRYCRVNTIQRELVTGAIVSRPAPPTLVDHAWCFMRHLPSMSITNWSTWTLIRGLRHFMAAIYVCRIYKPWIVTDNMVVIVCIVAYRHPLTAKNDIFSCVTTNFH